MLFLFYYSIYSHIYLNLLDSFLFILWYLDLSEMDLLCLMLVLSLFLAVCFLKIQYLILHDLFKFSDILTVLFLKKLSIEKSYNKCYFSGTCLNLVPYHYFFNVHFCHNIEFCPNPWDYWYDNPIFNQMLVQNNNW